jgi:hypothetical protein
MSFKFQTPNAQKKSEKYKINSSSLEMLIVDNAHISWLV